MRRIGPVLLALALAAPGYAAEGELRIKPAEFGAGTSGGMRRTIQPFDGWTLVCDEAVKLRQKVCNISQVVVDQSGDTAFSWSLAAKLGGAPVLIVRVNNGGTGGQAATLRLGADGRAVRVPLTECDHSLCLGLLPLDPLLAARIRRGDRAEITMTRDGRFTSFETSTAGLAAALKAVR